MTVLVQADIDDDEYECPARGHAGRLAYPLEHALLFGLGPHDEVVIRERVVWVREWSAVRDRILPKFIASFPARRPAAEYITGRVPMRPMRCELPLASRLRHTRCVYVDCGGDGFTYADLPLPYQTHEAYHLREHGIIDDDEFKLYRGYHRAASLATYRWEVCKK
jgi:hypothetical protein